jgi:hypothetical protein
VEQSYATGRLNGGSGTVPGGLIGGTGGSPTVSNSYWDIPTSGQSTSIAGTGMTTAQLQAALPSGFSNIVWWITPSLIR